MRRFRRVLKWLGLGLLVLLMAGAVYERIGRAKDSRGAPPVAEMVQVDGHAIRLICEGKGTRTFMLDSGLGGWSLHWFRIQSKLTELGRVCAYDRPGFGRSEPADLGHDGIAAADLLHAIIRAAGISTPFVYVGHSLGANFAQVYYGRYPKDVAALVLLEPGDPKDLLEDFKGTLEAAMAVAECGWQCSLVRAAGQVGLLRLAAQRAGSVTFGGNPDVLAEYRAGISRSTAVAGVLASYDALPKTAYQCMDVRSFGDTPVLVLSSTELRKPEGKETADDVRRWRVVYMAYLASLSAKSSRGAGPIEIPHSTHSSMVLGEEQAAEVVRNIAAFVSTLSPSSPPGA